MQTTTMPIDCGELPTVPATSLDAIPIAELYAHALDFRDALPYWPCLHAHVARSLERGLSARAEDAVDVAALAASIRAARRDQAQQWTAQLSAASRELCMWIVQQYAPTGLVDGCLLRAVIDLRLNETRIGAASLAMYAHEVGGGRIARHHGEMYRTLASSLDIELPDASGACFREDNEAMSASGGGDLLPCSFDLPCFLLALSAFPLHYLPELLGANLYYYAAGVSPAMLGLAPRLQALGAHGAFLEAHSPSEVSASMEALAIDVANWMLAGEGGEHGGAAMRARRLRAGFETARLLDDSWTMAVSDYTRAGGLSPAQQMLRLLERRGPGAVAYHKNLRLGPRKLDDWLAQVDTLGPDLLAALAKSAYVTPGKPERSKFLTQATAFGGPMFGIFSEAELNVVRRWIASLPERGKEPQPSVDEAAAPLPRAPSAAVSGGERPRGEVSSWFEDRPEVARAIEEYSSRPLAELYAELLQVELRPKVLPFARAYVEQWLERARVLFDPSTGSSIALAPGDVMTHEDYRLRPYSRASLEARIQLQHQRQRDSFVPMAVPPVTREQTIAETVLLVAGALSDGAWLQGIGSLMTRPRRTTIALFQIYADELGYGHLDRNHNVVFRQLLDSMGAHLPSVTDPGFPAACGVPDQAFGMALLWLCLSQFPKRFFPELLGLTLAIEVTGVGGYYRTNAQALNYYGFDSYILALHNTIDNVDAGHTRWICEAVHTYMSEIYDQGGPTLQASAWERVWSGVCAWALRVGF